GGTGAAAVGRVAARSGHGTVRRRRHADRGSPHVTTRTIKVPKPVVAVLLVGVLLFASGMVTVITAMAIWPGEAKLTAPLLCDDDRPDPFVVRDTYNVRPGETAMNFTLYCVGERGDFDEIGWMAPTLALWAGHTVILLVMALGVLAIVVARRSSRQTVA